MAYETKNIFNLDWVLENNVQLDVENLQEKHRVYWVVECFLSQRELETKKDKFDLLKKVVKVSQGTLYNWSRKKWNIANIYKQSVHRYYNGLPGSNTEKFRIHIIKDGKKVKTISVTPPEVFKYTRKTKNKIEVLDVKEIVSKRKEILENKTLEKRVFENEEEKEKLVLALCKEFATGTLTITESCAKHGIHYLQFVEMLVESDYLKQIYDEAVVINNTVQSSRQLTVADQRIIETLVSGKYQTIKVTQKRELDPVGKKDYIWVDHTRTITTRPLSLAEILTLKVAIGRAHQLGTILNPNEFAEMSDAELLSYINKNNSQVEK